MESLLLTVEDETGDLKTADAAEMRVIQEMHQTGKVALQSWAQRPVDKALQEIKYVVRQRMKRRYLAFLVVQQRFLARTLHKFA